MILGSWIIFFGSRCQKRPLRRKLVIFGQIFVPKIVLGDPHDFSPLLLTLGGNLAKMFSIKTRILLNSSKLYLLLEDTVECTFMQCVKQIWSSIAPPSATLGHSFRSHKSYLHSSQRNSFILSWIKIFRRHYITGSLKTAPTFCMT